MCACDSHADAAVGAAIMPRTGLCQCGIDAGLDAAFGLPTNSGKFRNYQIAGTLQHSLFAERERLNLAEITKMLEHIGDFEDVAGSHLVRKILEPIFPVAGGCREIVCEGLKERLAFARGYRAPKTDLNSIGNGNQNEGIGCGKSKRVKRKRNCSDLLLFDLFDCADPVIGVNNFLADLEAHLYTSESFYEHQASRTLRF